MGINLRAKIIKLFKKILPFSDEQLSESEVFKAKVELIMKEEKDFSMLYDYNKISSLNQYQQRQYLAELTKRYIDEKKKLLEEGIFNVE